MKSHEQNCLRLQKVRNTSAESSQSVSRKKPKRDLSSSWATLPATRIFLLGAGFSKPAGLPLTEELFYRAIEVAKLNFRVDGFSHLEHAVKQFRKYEIRIGTKGRFDLERFGEWLDWETSLRMSGSDTWSDYGSRASLQLKWAIGKVIHESTPRTLPDFYYDFASRLTPFDSVLTLNYDLVMEKALQTAGVPYRRFPSRYESVGDSHNITDSSHPQELRLHKLHGSVDWTHTKVASWDESLQTRSLVEGPRNEDDPLLDVSVIEDGCLDYYYRRSILASMTPPLLLYPSAAKPLAGSTLVPIWNGVGTNGSWLGGFSIIGCSMPKGDRYVLQLADQIAYGYVRGRKGAGGFPWRHPKMRVVNKIDGAQNIRHFKASYAFMKKGHTRFLMDGLSKDSVRELFPNRLK